MTSSYLFSSDGLVTLARYVAPDTLFAFDLDGTLAPIVEDYVAARVEEPVQSALERLVRLAKVAVITGRSREDAMRILGVSPHLLIGNHGAEWPVSETTRNWQFVSCCLKWRNRLDDMLFYEQGVEIEFKGESLSIHYRKANDREKTLSVIDAAVCKLTPVPRVVGGKYVVNLLPAEASTKRKALVDAMKILGLQRAVYFGDDVTDEEVFQEKSIDLFGIHVGKDDQTAASYYLNRQAELSGLLVSMVGILETQRDIEIA